MNTVTLIGRLTRDPDVSHPGESTIAKMRIAFNQSTNGDAGYVNVAAWGKVAEACGKYLKKGSEVGISGRLHWHEWEDEEKIRHQSLDVTAHKVDFLRRAPEGADAPEEHVGF